MLALKPVYSTDHFVTCGTVERPWSTGHWVGSGIAELGASGHITDAGLAAYLPTLRPYIKSPVIAYDLVCATPASVTALWALSQRQHVREVLERGSAGAAIRALDYLERNAAATPRGPSGIRTLDIRGGLIGVRFQHGQAREGVTDLHDHVVILNLVKGTDGRWGVLDGNALHAYMEAASEHHTGRLIDIIEQTSRLRFVQRSDPAGRGLRWELKSVKERDLTPFRAAGSVREQAVTR